MHGLIFGTSVHYWQDQPGILRVRDIVPFAHNILARVQYRLHQSARISVSPSLAHHRSAGDSAVRHHPPPELQPTPPSLVASASQHDHITVHHLHAAGCLVQTAAMSDCSLVVVQPKSRTHWHPTQSVATVPLLNMPSESSDCRIPCSAAGLAIGARSALQRPSQTLWIHQTRTGVHRAVRKCDHRSIQLEFTSFHRAGREKGTRLVG